MSSNILFPGDKIASIEEYEAGKNTFDDGDMVRAATIGKPNLNMPERIAEVMSSKELPVPQSGDIVIGTIAAVMSSMIAVTVNFINGRKVQSNVEVICGTKNIRKKTIGLMGDIIKLKVIGNLNGTNHANIDHPSLGILFTKCRKCGGKVIQLRDAVKCTECSWIDDRKLSSDFGNSDFIKIE